MWLRLDATYQRDCQILDCAPVELGSLVSKSVKLETVCCGNRCARASSLTTNLSPCVLVCFSELLVLLCGCSWWDSALHTLTNLYGFFFSHVFCLPSHLLPPMAFSLLPIHSLSPTRRRTCVWWRTLISGWSTLAQLRLTMSTTAQWCPQDTTEPPRSFWSWAGATTATCGA